MSQRRTPRHADQLQTMSSINHTLRPPATRCGYKGHDENRPCHPPRSPLPCIESLPGGSRGIIEEQASSRRRPGYTHAATSTRRVLALATRHPPQSNSRTIQTPRAQRFRYPLHHAPPSGRHVGSAGLLRPDARRRHRPGRLRRAGPATRHLPDRTLVPRLPERDRRRGPLPTLRRESGRVDVPRQGARPRHPHGTCLNPAFCSSSRLTSHLGRPAPANDASRWSPRDRGVRHGPMRPIPSSGKAPR